MFKGEGREERGKGGGGPHALRGLTCFNWTVRLSSSSLTHTMAGWRTLLGSSMSTWAEDKLRQFTSGPWTKKENSRFQHYLLTHIRRCVSTHREQPFKRAPHYTPLSDLCVSLLDSSLTQKSACFWPCVFSHAAKT